MHLLPVPTRTWETKFREDRKTILSLRGLARCPLRALAHRAGTVSLPGFPTLPSFANWGYPCPR